MTSNDRVSPSWFVQLDLDKPFLLSMLDKILDLQRYGEGGKEGRGGRKVGRGTLRERRREGKSGGKGGREEG